MSEYFRVPQTREEVISHFKTYPDKFFSEVMTELFLLYHDDMGRSVSQAYEDTLRAAVEDTRPTKRAPDACPEGGLHDYSLPLSNHTLNRCLKCGNRR